MEPCNKCGSVSFYLERKGAAVEMRCCDCNAYKKFVKLSEVPFLQSQGIKFIEHDVNECPSCHVVDFYLVKSEKGTHIQKKCKRCNKHLGFVGKVEKAQLLRRGYRVYPYGHTF